MMDWVLLQDYARKRSEESFQVLVDRHLNLVFSAAFRQLRSRHLAEEVAQSVFVQLAEWAPRLSEKTVLSAWLYEVTRRKAIDVIRAEQRRKARELIATETSMTNSPDSDWSQLEPALDEAMAGLNASDRTAIILRFFENKSLREVGAALGASEDTAQKRVSRALERLRRILEERGFALGGTSLAAALSANAVQAAPAGLALSVGSAAVGAAAHTSAVALTQTIFMTTTQKALAGSILLCALGTGIFEATRVAHLKSESNALAREQSLLINELQGLRQDYKQALQSLAALERDNLRLQSNTAELAKLRGEVTRWRAGSQQPAQQELEPELKMWLARVAALKERLRAMPEHNVPDFELLSEQDWLEASKREIRTELDLRRAFSQLRRTAQGKFASMAHDALTQFMEANNGSFPTELSQLQPYLNPPVSSAVLDSWQIAPASTVSNLGMGGDKIITQKRAVDDTFDSRFGIGPKGRGSTDFLSSTSGAAMAEIHKLYQAANSGRSPKDPAELLPYATSPEEQELVHKYIERKSASE